MVDARAHGLIDGYIFPVHGRRGLLGSMTIGGSVVDLSPVEIALFDAVAKKVFWRLLELTRRSTITGKMVSSVDVQLTRREMEVLNYLADGMTSNRDQPDAQDLQPHRRLVHERHPG